MSGEGEVGGEASGQASAQGSTCSKEWATAELLDTVERREVDGGRGYSGEVAAAASAMVWERRGRGDGGEWRCPEARGASRGSSSTSTGETASRWRRGELALAGVTSLPALARAGS